MKNFKILFALLAILAIGFMSFTIIGGNHKAKQTVVTENKKFASVTFYYVGPCPASLSDITNPANWTTTPQTCPSGTTCICSITFDDVRYPLDHGNPNSTVLGLVANHWTTTASGTDIIDGGTDTGILLVKKS